MKEHFSFHCYIEQRSFHEDTKLLAERPALNDQMSSAKNWRQQNDGQLRSFPN